MIVFASQEERAERLITPTHEFWAEENMISTTWSHPLSAEELSGCFCHLARMIGGKAHTVQVLFDLTQTKAIPSSAAILAIRSGFLNRANTGEVAVVTSDVIAEILAGIASRITHHPIHFFTTSEAARAYLDAVDPQPVR